MRQPPIVPGQVFGRLTALTRCGYSRSGGVIWGCMCVCGTTKLVPQRLLTRGNTRSCGCLAHEVRLAQGARLHYVHGGTGTAAYRAWKWMRLRAVPICDAWATFAEFHADMGDPPPGAGLSRLNPRLGYHPENCAWLTRRERHRRTAPPMMLTYNGVTQPMPEWAESAGLAVNTLRARLTKGWNVERAITTPLRPHRKKEKTR